MTSLQTLADCIAFIGVAQIGSLLLHAAFDVNTVWREVTLRRALDVVLGAWAFFALVWG
jgi:hypothetical protein